MKIGIVGTGNVGRTLGKLFFEKNHSITYVNPNISNEFKLDNIDKFQFVDLEDISLDTDIIILAIPGNQLENVLPKIKNLENKIIIDCTNPIAADFKSLWRGTDTSNGEVAQKLAPNSFIVKTLNTTGIDNMKIPKIKEENLTMLISGNYSQANKLVSDLVNEIGFHPLITGPLYHSRFTEAIGMLWVDMSYNQNLGTKHGLKWIIE